MTKSNKRIHETPAGIVGSMPAAAKQKIQRAMKPSKLPIATEKTPGRTTAAIDRHKPGKAALEPRRG